MKKLIATTLAAMMLAAPVVYAAPEYGEHVTVATVADYEAKYSGVAIQYTRVIELQHSGENNGTLVATYELLGGPQEEGYHIHISRDGGSTWEEVAMVCEQSADMESEWMPMLYELPCQIGDMPEGTLLLAACSMDPARTEITALQLYRSADIGVTWEEFGTVVVGGGGSAGVWEPFLMVLPDGRLACYYSDCTEGDKHSQKLAMKISEDGVTWGEGIDIVALEDQTQRPGMVTVAKMNDGRYIMSYEMCNAENADCGNPVYYRFSDDGVNWGDPTDPGTKLVTDTGAVPGSSPYIAYVPGYGENGLLLLTSAFQTPGQSKGNIIYINDQLGAEDAWQAWFLPKRYRRVGGYSHAIFPAADGRTAYFVNNIPDPNSEKGYTQMIFVRYCFEDDFLSD